MNALSSSWVRKPARGSIARASALHACLRAVGDFYAYHRRRAELTYSDRL